MYYNESGSKVIYKADTPVKMCSNSGVLTKE